MGTRHAPRRGNIHEKRSDQPGKKGPPTKASTRELTPLPDAPPERHAHRVILKVSGRRFEITLYAETREITGGPAKIIEMPGRPTL
jgi:hypothetical protein